MIILDHRVAHLEVYALFEHICRYNNVGFIFLEPFDNLRKGYNYRFINNKFSGKSGSSLQMILVFFF